MPSIKGSDLMSEEWKWVKGYEGLYKISSHGRLMSFHKYKDGRLRKLSNSKGWYLSFPLTDKNGKARTKRIHVLVAENFIGEIPKGFHVHHKDGNKQDNKADNLEIVSTLEHHIKTMEQIPELTQGMNNYNSYERPNKIPQYTLDGHFIAEYANAAIASKYTNVCQRNILQVARREEYKPGLTRSQAGGFVWKFSEAREVIQCS